MTLPLFDYVAPRSLGDALSILGASKEEARPLAGGQSLMPILAFRLAAPGLLVDLRHLDELRRIEIGAEATILGALVRWCDIEQSAALAAAHPLLTAAVSHIAHYQIRNRGTVGGSLAHADPAAELPGVAVTCDGIVTIASTKKGRRTLPATEFFLGPLTTALAQDELVVDLRLPAWPAGRRWAFHEFARRRGDFAIAGVALHYDLDATGRAMDSHLGVFGAGPAAQRLAEAEAVLNGHVVDASTIEAVAAAVRQAIDPPDDLHASARYRRALVGTLVERALRDAATRDVPC